MTAQVRKHRAPKGALRLRERTSLSRYLKYVRKQQAPKGALRRKAVGVLQECEDWVGRKRRAPKGALRHGMRTVVVVEEPRGQKAPSVKRALRRKIHEVIEHHDLRQKAPRAIRCIKTCSGERGRHPPHSIQTATSTMRCIRTHRTPC